MIFSIWWIIEIPSIHQNKPSIIPTTWYSWIKLITAAACEHNREELIVAIVVSGYNNCLKPSYFNDTLITDFSECPTNRQICVNRKIVFGQFYDLQWNH